MTHQDLKKKFASRSNGRKLVRGWYAWKPVAIKQALDRFPYVLYIDAGSVVCKCLDNLFSYIQEKGYFLLQDPTWGVTVQKVNGLPRVQQKQFVIEENATKFVLDALKLNTPERSWIKKVPGIVAGVQGLSQKMLENYVLPVYELTRDLRYFQDDGSGMYGFGWARHDQVIFSIHARLVGLNLIKACKSVKLECGGNSFDVLCGRGSSPTPDIFFACKGQMDFTGDIRLID